MKIAVRCI